MTAIKEALQELIRCMDLSAAGQPVYERWKHAVNNARAALSREVPQESVAWVRVSERLPELVERDDSPLPWKSDSRATLSSKRVLVFNDWGIRITYLVGEEGSSATPDWFAASNVTHWMPLPEPPSIATPQVNAAAQEPKCSSKQFDETTPAAATPSSDRCPGKPTYCKNMKSTYEGMDGERYRCDVCGESYFLDYEDMR